MIVEVTMYRAVCDHEGCYASAQDEGDFYAHIHKDLAVEDATDSGWWQSEDKSALLCEQHAPQLCEVCAQRHLWPQATAAPVVSP